MFKLLKLLLPALLPSWRFFDVIAPSPRIQYCLSTKSTQSHSPSQPWTTFQSRPNKLSFGTMCARMFWNPAWNESLFLVSCAERLVETPTVHSEQEIMKRIVATLLPADISSPYVQFRLLLISLHKTELIQEVVFYSRIQPLISTDKHCGI